MHNLTHTSWLLIHREDSSGWTIYPGIIYPSDILMFEEYHLHNKTLSGENSATFPYKLQEKELDVGKGTWEIESRTEDQLILICRSQKFRYQLIPSEQQELSEAYENLEAQLTAERWFIEGAFDEKEVNLCLFLKEKLEFGKYLPHQYFTWIKIGYHRNLMERSESLVSGWKLVKEGKSQILSLFDLHSTQNLLLTEATEEKLIFKGKNELHLRKAKR